MTLAKPWQGEERNENGSRSGEGVGREGGDETEIVTESQWEIEWKGGARSRRLRESSDREKQKKERERERAVCRGEERAAALMK